MSSIKNLSKVLNLKVEGTDKVPTIDFSDKRLVNRVLHLMKKYRGIDDKVNEKIQEISKIEDELDRYIHQNLYLKQAFGMACRLRI